MKNFMNMIYTMKTIMELQKKLMNEKIDSGKIIVKDIEVNGTENLIKKLGNDTKLVTIFLKVDKEELKIDL